MVPLDLQKGDAPAHGASPKSLEKEGSPAGLPIPPGPQRPEKHLPGPDPTWARQGGSPAKRSGSKAPKGLKTNSSHAALTQSAAWGGGGGSTEYAPAQPGATLGPAPGLQPRVARGPVKGALGPRAPRPGRASTHRSCRAPWA